jgi:asparagine synthase (glutamine-hydrolysing)
MFGFVGSSDAAARTDIDAVLSSLRHRGPDDHDTYAETFSIGGKGNQTCILAQTRLSVIDLTLTEHKPTSSHDGRWRLVVNGEIYNHRELKDNLVKDGERFVGSSDTAVVVHALVKWGPAGRRQEINGMFAFALWDRASASLTLARDRSGEKPLYVGLPDRAGSFDFASEVRTLLASDQVQRVTSRRGLNPTSRPVPYRSRGP